MTDWEGQVIAAAVRELLGAFRSLARDGFGRRDRALLSAVMRGLLSCRSQDTPRDGTVERVGEMRGKAIPRSFLSSTIVAPLRERGGRVHMGYTRSAEE